MNKIWEIGYIITEPETRTLDSGARTASFRIAVPRDYTNSQGIRESDFFTVVVWRQLADFVGKYLSKGRKVSVCGSIHNRTYTAQDGSVRHVDEIKADSIDFADSKPAENDRQPVKQPSVKATPRNVPKTEMEQQGFQQVDDEELPF